jgi:hypothetical protein
MRNGTERPSPLPVDLTLVSVCQRGCCTTVSSIVEPGGAVAVPAGDWVGTVPGSWPGAGARVMRECSPAAASALCASPTLRPTTSGTSIGRGPALTTARTLLLRRTCLPARGCWAMTVPFLRSA